MKRIVLSIVLLPALVLQGAFWNTSSKKNIAKAPSIPAYDVSVLNKLNNSVIVSFGETASIALEDPRVMTGINASGETKWSWKYNTLFLFIHESTNRKSGDMYEVRGLDPKKKQKIYVRVVRDKKRPEELHLEPQTYTLNNVKVGQIHFVGPLSIPRVAAPMRPQSKPKISDFSSAASSALPAVPSRKKVAQQDKSPVPGQIDPEIIAREAKDIEKEIMEVKKQEVIDEKKDDVAQLQKDKQREALLLKAEADLKAALDLERKVKEEADAVKAKAEAEEAARKVREAEELKKQEEALKLKKATQPPAIKPLAKTAEDLVKNVEIKNCEDEGGKWSEVGQECIKSAPKVPQAPPLTSPVASASKIPQAPPMSAPNIPMAPLLVPQAPPLAPAMGKVPAAPAMSSAPVVPPMAPPMSTGEKPGREEVSAKSELPAPQSGRDDLLAAIREGKTLRKVQAPAEKPAPQDAQSALLSAIKGGVQLKKADQPSPSEKPAAPQSILAAGLAKQRAAVAPEDEEEDAGQEDEFGPAEKKSQIKIPSVTTQKSLPKAPSLGGIPKAPSLSPAPAGAIPAAPTPAVTQVSKPAGDAGREDMLAQIQAGGFKLKKVSLKESTDTQPVVSTEEKARADKIAALKARVNADAAKAKADVEAAEFED